MRAVWVPKRVVLAIHEEQLAEHGGAPGLRDEGLLDSALARPINLNAYAMPDTQALAAAYAYGIVRNPPFVDSNKRTSFVTAALFLDLNGASLRASNADKVVTWLALASGDLSEAALAEWLRHSR